MLIAHILRKLDPAEWSGTEMAIQRLLDGLRAHGVQARVFCPRLPLPAEPDPLVRAGVPVHRFRAFVPVLGLSQERRRQLVSVGGNLMSFQLLPTLWRQRDLAVIHTHTLGRLGGIGLTVARQRRLPFVVTIHGGLLDLPKKLQQTFNEPLDHGWEWGKLFGLLFQSHRLLRDADAILTCNSREAALLQQQLPAKRVVVQPHGVPLHLYQKDHSVAALTAFPQLANRDVLLCLGRLDPVKNQGWLLDQLPAIVQKHPRALLVLAGPCTDEPYGRLLREKIQKADFSAHVLLTGGLPPNDPRVIGLLQTARVLLLPSLSETFGLVILEAWAAGTMVISARASGPAALVRSGNNGWLFDLEDPAGFHQALERTLGDRMEARSMVQRGRELAAQYGIEAVAAHLRTLYEELVEEKLCTT
jgi:glycosyltransferase involved in cell wall biosynthesis